MTFLRCKRCGEASSNRRTFTITEEGAYCRSKKKCDTRHQEAQFDCITAFGESRVSRKLAELRLKELGYDAASTRELLA